VKSHPALRLRAGVGMFIFSWLPIAQLWIWIGDLSGNRADEVRATVWAIQWTIGIIGLILAGAAAKTVLKRTGKRGLPKALWTMLRTGTTTDLPATAEPSSTI
jgi:hypothetical protein